MNILVAPLFKERDQHGHSDAELEAIGKLYAETVGARASDLSPCDVTPSPEKLQSDILFLTNELYMLRDNFASLLKVLQLEDLGLLT